jgi:hypothetical protein
VPALRTMSNVQKTPALVGSSVPSTENIIVLVPPPETSRSTIPTAGPNEQQSAVPTTVSHTQ